MTVLLSCPGASADIPPPRCLTPGYHTGSVVSGFTPTMVEITNVILPTHTIVKQSPSGIAIRLTTAISAPQEVGSLLPLLFGSLARPILQTSLLS
jgi:hypothetical protein